MSVSKLVLGVMFLMTAGCEPCCHPDVAAKPSEKSSTHNSVKFTPDTPESLEVAKPAEPKQ